MLKGCVASKIEVISCESCIRVGILFINRAVATKDCKNIKGQINNMQMWVALIMMLSPR